MVYRHRLLGAHQMLSAIIRVSTHLEHLGGHNDWLSSNVTLGNHHFLGQENAARWDLNTKIAASDHNTIRLFENLVEVEDTLFVLNLDNNLDISTVWT